MRTPREIVKAAFAPVALGASWGEFWRSFVQVWKNRLMVLGFVWGVGIMLIGCIVGMSILMTLLGHL